MEKFSLLMKILLFVQILMSALKRQDVNVQNVSAQTSGVVTIANALAAFSTFMNMILASVNPHSLFMLPEHPCHLSHSK
jgi:hypothetical protein